MIYHRPSQDRGLTTNDWLTSRHSFSFGEYHDRKFMGFRSLRVINEDWIAPGGGFPTHGHRDMEIITYVIEGELAHKDSLGNGSRIKPGEIQIMSAGTGIQHSEYNSADHQKTHLLQIWIIPEKQNLPPRYDQMVFNAPLNQLTPLCARNNSEGVLPLFQDAVLYVAKTQENTTLSHSIASSRYGWVQLIKGTLQVNEIEMQAGDGAGIAEESNLTFTSKNGEAEFLFFELA